MISTSKKFVFILSLVSFQTAIAFNGTIRFSNEFYAAQKYFYSETKKKFPKIVKEKFYPEVPIRGNISNDELKKIMPMMDFFEARQSFADEVSKYPEQIFPEIFAFLNNHPALSLSSGNKPKFEAIETYFLPFNYVFCSDKHYFFNPEVKSNPCPLVFYYSDDKKNTLSFNLSNVSKKTMNFNLNEGLVADYFTYAGKRPITVKAGSTTSVKLSINLTKLKADSTFKLFNFIFSDPTQPKIKIIVSAILLPSKDFLNLPAHFYNLLYSYNTHLKNIDLYKDRTSGPEPCKGNECATEKFYTLRSSDRSVKQYSFGDFCTIQYNLCSLSPPFYSSKSNQLQILFNELGTLEGTPRNCPGTLPQTSTPCPPETANNGKEIYGSRKIEVTLYVPPGKSYDLKLMLNYSDLKTQLQQTPELSWLQDKKLVCVISDLSKKIIHKEFSVNNLIATQKKGLTEGIYTLAIYPTNEDSNKLNPSFEINYLNHGGKARFDFSFKSTLTLSPSR